MKSQRTKQVINLVLGYQVIFLSDQSFLKDNQKRAIFSNKIPFYNSIHISLQIRPTFNFSQSLLYEILENVKVVTLIVS